MLAVVDANAVFSALLLPGKPFLVFKLNAFVGKYEFIAPEYLFAEIGEHLDKLLEETKFPVPKMVETFSFIKDQINFIPLEEFSKFNEDAVKISPDPDDVQYFALSLKYGKVPILSGDSDFKKQSIIEILTPAKALEELMKELIP